MAFFEGESVTVTITRGQLKDAGANRDAEGKGESCWATLASVVDLGAAPGGGRRVAAARVPGRPAVGG